MKKILFSVLTLVLGLVLSGSDCSGPDPVPDPSTTDAGVKIGDVTWATRNVGEPKKFAANSTSTGLYYQFNRKTGWSVTNPLTSNPSGITWNTTGAPDAEWAAANDPCPEGWQVPTEAQFTALIAAGYKWEGTKNGATFGSGANTIFLPAAGIRNQTSGFEYANEGLYWLKEGWGPYASIVSFDSSNGSISSIHSACGLPVRCVKK